MARAAAVMLALAFGCGGGDGAGAGDAAAGDWAAGGVQRGTLTGNYLTSTTGQGWDLATGRLASNAADADFALSMAMVISLSPRKPQVGFCKRQPPGGAAAFTRVEEIPSDVAGCASWSLADLGGNSPLFENYVRGHGFIVRDRNAMPVARLMAVSGSVVAADVTVTFDIMKF